jgi:predicted nucleic acid-binding protein
MKVTLNTNILYSIYYSKDSNHLKAKQFFRKQDRKIEYVIPSIAYIELLAGIESSYNAKAFCSLITQNTPLITRTDINFVAELDPKIRKVLKANDCLILAITSRTESKLVTFDSKLSKIAKKLDLLYDY